MNDLNNDSNKEALLKNKLQEQARDFFQENDVLSQRLANALAKEYAQSSQQNGNLDIKKASTPTRKYWSRVASVISISFVIYFIYANKSMEHKVTVPPQIANLSSEMLKLSSTTYQKKLINRIDNTSFKNLKNENVYIQSDVKKLIKWFSVSAKETNQKRS